MTRCLAWGLLLALAAPALAADLDPKLAAKISRDQKKALAELAARGKKLSEMDPEERRDSGRQRDQAQQAVLDKHEVTAKAFARYTAKLAREEQKEQAAAEEALEAQEALEARQKAEAPSAEDQGPTEVSVQQGFSGDDLVELEAEEGAEPPVEQGLPADDER